MQLGELQSQYSRFVSRGADVVAISVDPTDHSRSMIRRLGLEFPVISDEDQQVQKAFGVQNPETQALALHAVYIVDADRRVFYRKVASRRPLAQELLDAIDYQAGTYPLNDERSARPITPVAFPKNIFQALIEISTNAQLDEKVDPAEFMPIIELMKNRRLDDATIAYRNAMDALADELSRDQMERLAAWFTQEVLQLPEEALLTGRALADALVKQREIREHNELDQEALEAVERDLDTLRTLIRNSSKNWHLDPAKTTLRSHRELSLAALNSDS